MWVKILCVNGLMIQLCDEHTTQFSVKAFQGPPIAFQRFAHLQKLKSWYLTRKCTNTSSLPFLLQTLTPCSVLSLTGVTPVGSSITSVFPKYVGNSALYTNSHFTQVQLQKHDRKRSFSTFGSRSKGYIYLK